MAGRRLICSANKTVDVINDLVMDKFPGHSREHRSFESVETDAHLYPTEFLNSLLPSGMPPHKMCLKVGCPVMLLRNLDPQHGYIRNMGTYLPTYMTMSLKRLLQSEHIRTIDSTFRGSQLDRQKRAFPLS